MTVGETFGKESEVKQCKIADMFVAVPPHRRRHLIARMREQLKYILQLPSRFVLDAIHIFDLHEFGEKIRDVLDGVGIAQIQLPHSTFGQSLEEPSDRMVGRNLMLGFFNHATILW